MSIYNLTESIVNLSNEEEAKNKLLDSNILLLNNHEYYKTIISSFIQKKESIIKKENDKLVFDLNNTNDIWNIVFIGEYIKENDLLYKSYNELLLRISDIECNLSLIKDKHKGVTTQEAHKLINEEYQIVNTELRECKTQLDNMKSVLEAFYNTDWVNLTNSNESIDSLKETEVLKQAINIIHKVRNSFEHDNPEINSNIHIKNDSFNFSIPIEYLDGFNKGRIIANNKDDVIVEKTNLIALPLLEELNCDINDIQSLFYNIDPELLSMLLKEANYNVKDLFRFSKRVLYEEGPRTKEILRAGYGIDIIEKISGVICNTHLVSIEQIIDTLNYLKKNNLLDKYILTNPFAYNNTDILDLYIKAGIEPEVINTLDIACFYNLKYANNLIVKLNRLSLSGISYTKLIDRLYYGKITNNIPYDYADKIIELKKYLIRNNIPIEVLYDDKLLKEEFFNNVDRFKKLLSTKDLMTNYFNPIFWYTIFPNDKRFNTDNWIVDYLNKYNIDYRFIGVHGESFEKFKNYLIEKELYPYKEEYEHLYIILEYLRIMELVERDGLIFKKVSIYNCIVNLLESGFTIEEIDSLSIKAIVDYKSIIYLKNYHVSFDEIKDISCYGLKKCEPALELLNYLKENDIPIDIVKPEYWDNSKNILLLLKQLPKDKISIIKDLTFNSFSNSFGIGDYYDSTNIVNCLIDNNIDILKVPYSLIEGRENSYKIVEWIKNNNYDLKLLEKLPVSAFIGFTDEIVLSMTHDQMNKIAKKENPNQVFESTKGIIETFINNGYTSDKEMPEKIFLVPTCKKENLEYLLKLVNYDFKKLDEFPVEFYTCDYELLDNMCKNYNYNLCMSLFGLDNPKIIVSLIYGNSVFSQYQKELDDNTLIDIDPMTIIHAGFNTTMYYKDNIKNESFNEESYLKQFMYDDNNQKRSSEDLKKYLLDKLRNSLAHFRFKPVLDKEGNIVNDKIYIYDTYDESSNNNFDLIIDIKDFIEITREIELGLLKKNNENVIEDNRFKVR